MFDGLLSNLFDKCKRSIIGAVLEEALIAVNTQRSGINHAPTPAFLCIRDPLTHQSLNQIHSACLLIYA